MDGHAMSKPKRKPVRAWAVVCGDGRVRVQPTFTTLPAHYVVPFHPCKFGLHRIIELREIGRRK